MAENMERAATTIAMRRDAAVVRVTCPEGFSAHIVDQLTDLRAQHPELVVEIIADVRPLDLARGEADIALRMSPTTQLDLVERKLCEMAWKMFASREYVERHGVPDPITDLRGHDVVTYDGGVAHVPGARWLAAHADGATTVFRGNSLHAVLDAAATGLGLIVAPYFLASREPRLQLLSPATLGTRTLSIIVHAALQKVVRVRTVIDHLAAAIARDHARGVFG
jgi:DNA-binding transcriptional LysR family regulator